jgi:RecQ-mediated genome instability protein 1
LGECYEWLVDQLQISSHDTKRLTDSAEEALLDSDLKDSMQPGTGFPEGISTAEDLTVQGSSILVQIVDITEIGNSAFSLTNVRQTRLDQEDLAGLARQNGEENENENEADEDVGPIPKYPRSMLKLHLSDGSTTMPAIEFKKIPGLELGVTPLGCKVILYSV